MNLSSRTIQYLIINSLLLLVAIGSFGFLTLSINEKKSTAAVAFSEIELLQNQNSQLKDLSSVLKDINQDQEQLNSYFVHTEEIVHFLEAVEAIGRDSGATVEVRSLNEEETSNATISLLTLNLTAKGEWDNVYHFLTLIQSYPVISTFDRIHISGNEVSTFDDEGNEIGSDVEWSSVINMKVLELKDES